MGRNSQRWMGIGTEFIGSVFPDGTMGLGFEKRIHNSSEVSCLMRQWDTIHRDGWELEQSSLGMFFLMGQWDWDLRKGYTPVLKLEV